MFNMFDKVRVLDGDNRLVKEGIIIGLTSVGAKVYQPKCEHPFSDSMEFAEWFPYHSKEVKMLPSQSKRRQRV